MRRRKSLLLAMGTARVVAAVVRGMQPPTELSGGGVAFDVADANKRFSL
jgi:hypothetical protein